MGKFILNGKVYTGNSADGFPPLIYSDDEREVGVWRDGKPLYQRVFKGQLTASALYDNICTKTDYNIDEIVNFDGYWGNKSVGYFAQLGCFIENGFFGGIYISGSTVQLYHPRNLDYYVVILRYTKTTDTAGSGYWSTNGDRAIHCSTTEQVIGTWIDGKPLYEKVIDIGSLPQVANTAKNVEHNISNIDTVCLLRGVAKNSSGTILPLPYIAPDNLGYGIQLSATSTYIVLRTGTDRSAFSGYAIIQYTKTTD